MGRCDEVHSRLRGNDTVMHDVSLTFANPRLPTPDSQLTPDSIRPATSQCRAMDRKYHYCVARLQGRWRAMKGLVRVPARLTSEAGKH
jgi:hypothetical protein